MVGSMGGDHYRDWSLTFLHCIELGTWNRKLWTGSSITKVTVLLEWLVVWVRTIMEIDPPLFRIVLSWKLGTGKLEHGNWDLHNWGHTTVGMVGGMGEDHYRDWSPTFPHCIELGTGNWELGAGNWELGTVNRKLRTGSSTTEIPLLLEWLVVWVRTIIEIDPQLFRIRVGS